MKIKHGTKRKKAEKREELPYVPPLNRIKEFLKFMGFAEGQDCAHCFKKGTVLYIIPPSRKDYQEFKENCLKFEEFSEQDFANFEASKKGGAL